MSAADTAFEDLWARAAAIIAAEVSATSRDVKRPRTQPAANNVGLALLIIAVALVLAAAALIGSPALHRFQEGCETASSQVSGTECSK